MKVVAILIEGNDCDFLREKPQKDEQICAISVYQKMTVRTGHFQILWEIDCMLQLLQKVCFGIMSHKPRRSQTNKQLCAVSYSLACIHNRAWTRIM